jgi:hypothetical protein
MSKKRRVDVEYNRTVIHDAYLALAVELKRKPRLVEVSAKCGLSYHTVSKHIATLNFDPPKDSLRILTPSVLYSIFASATNGNSAAQKLWLQVMENWVEKKEEDMGQKGVTRLIRKKADDD